MTHTDGSAVIVGVGETELGRVSNRTTMSLHIEAARAAIYDAGLSKDDIDGVLCIHPVLAETPRFHMFFSEQMGIFVKTLCDSLTIGGASPGHALQVARWAIESGQCKAVLVVGAESLLTGSGGDSGGGVASYATLGAHSLEFEYPYGAHIPAFYALLAKRYMHEFGTTSEQLARIAVACRKHAALNPKAQMREPITVDDVLTSKAVSTPLRKLDCSLISDGGAAVVITSLARARDLARPPIHILGIGEAHSTYHMGHLVKGGGGYDLVNTVCQVAAKRAFGEAGLSPGDVDVAEIYDSFTITAMIQLEEIGFCAKGEGGSFVEDGNIELGGALPLNTHGGLLSCAHPGVPGGLLHMVEAVTQLRGDAGERQVSGACVALCTNASAVASNFSMALLGREPR